MKKYLLEESIDLTKLIRTMKITCFLLIAFASATFAIHANSQVTKVSIDMKNETLAKVIDEIERQTGYLFVYNANEINLEQKVSVSARQKSVTDLLAAVFDKTDIGFALEGYNIMLMQRTGVQPREKRVTGKVTDEERKQVRQKSMFS